MMKAITNARVLTPEGFKTGQSILFHKGVIAKICADGYYEENVEIEHDLGGQTVLPGFIDVQVNGGGGVLFNDNLTVEGIKTIGEAHRKFGTTGFFPTLISDDLDVMAKAIKAVDAAIEQGVPGVLGIHLEGPFLNEEKRGVHDSSKFMRISDKELALVTSLRRGKTLLTLAPEKTVPDTIKALQNSGVIIAAGHTQARYEETLLALDAGLTGFTHLFNAMPQLMSRAPGIIAAALQDKRAWRGIIVDGYHVHPAMLRLAYRAQAGDQMFLVSDAMPSVGAADKKFSLGGVKIKVKNGRCTALDGTLAGSDLDMMSAVSNAVDILGVDLGQAVRMASILPACFMGIQNTGEIRTGYRANFVVISKQMKVVDTWIDGQVLA